MMGAIQWIEDLEEMEEEENSHDMKIKKRRREKDIDEVKANYLCDSLW